MPDTVEQRRQELGRVHADTPYYGEAEAASHVAIFWGEQSLFKRMFDLLDLSNVVDLACGHGRHSAQIIDRAAHVTLVDINETNIQACAKRFSGRSNVSFLVNDGASLADLPSGNYSAVFSYDAMVHFESTDVISYLKEISRILRPGGRALLHYSNNQDFPEGDYRDCPRWRNFFSEKMFRHFANRAGFETLESHIISWPPSGGTPEIDAVTLIQKIDATSAAHDDVKASST